MKFDLGIKSKNEFLQENSFIDLVSGGSQLFLTLPCKDKIHFYLLDKHWNTLQNLIENKIEPFNSNETSDADGKNSDSNYFFKKSFVPSGTIIGGQNKLISAFASGGTTSAPGRWTSFSGSGYKYTEAVFFYSIFDPFTLEHLPKNEPVIDKGRELGDFVDQKHLHLKEPLLIDKMIVSGYLNTDSKKFGLVKF